MCTGESEEAAAARWDCITGPGITHPQSSERFWHERRGNSGEEEEEDSQITVIIPRFIVSPPFSPRRFRHKSLAGFAEGENTWISLVNYFSSCVMLQLLIQISKASIVEFSFKVSFATTMPTHHRITTTKSGGGST